MTTTNVDRLEELKLKIAQHGNGFSMNEIISDIKNLLSQARQEGREEVIGVINWRGKGFSEGNDVLTWIDEQLQALTTEGK